MNEKYIGLTTVGSTAIVERSRKEIMASGNSNKRDMSRLLTIRERWPEDLVDLYERQPRIRQRPLRVGLQRGPVLVNMTGPWEIIYRGSSPPSFKLEDLIVLLYWAQNRMPLCGWFMNATCLDDLCWYRRHRQAFSRTTQQLPNNGTVNNLQRPRVTNIANLILSNENVTFFVKNNNRFYRAVPVFLRDSRVAPNSAGPQPEHMEDLYARPRSRATSVDRARLYPGPSSASNTSTSSIQRPRSLDRNGSGRY